MLEAVLAALPDALLGVDASGTIRIANRRAEELFAFAPGALAGRAIETVAPGALEAVEGHDLRGRRADGAEFPIEVALGRAEVQAGTLVVAIVRDVTVRNLRDERLLYLSEHDALTGVLNRRGFERQLAQALAQARRHGIDTALMLLDLDRFKLVNDLFGHLEGDRVLRLVVQAISSRLRAGDTLARLGGDECAVILPFAGTAAAAAIGSELLAVVRDAGRLATNGAVDISASIGIVGLGHGRRDATAAIAAADGAMYEAKLAGGDAVREVDDANGGHAHVA
jgi:diguanylate cyclase (GGDEF)-like protein